MIMASVLPMMLMFVDSILGNSSSFGVAIQELPSEETI